MRSSMHLSSNINKNQSKWAINPLITMSDQDRIYPYNVIKQTSDENIKISVRGL